MNRLSSIWKRSNQPLTKLVSNILSAGGYESHQFENIFFMGIPDSELVRCMDEYEALEKVENAAGK